MEIYVQKVKELGSSCKDDLRIFRISSQSLEVCIRNSRLKYQTIEVFDTSEEYKNSRARRIDHWRKINKTL